MGRPCITRHIAEYFFYVSPDCKAHLSFALSTHTGFSLFILTTFKYSKGPEN